MSSNQGIISLSIKEKPALFKAYMPFIEGGGLFIPTAGQYMMGDEVFILLTLINETEKLPLAGLVIWKTPPGSEGRHPQGIGVQFSEQEDGGAKNKIEGYLAGMSNSGILTNTL